MFLTAVFKHIYSLGIHIFQGVKTGKILRKPLSRFSAPCVFSQGPGLKYPSLLFNNHFSPILWKKKHHISLLSYCLAVPQGVNSSGHHTEDFSTMQGSLENKAMWYLEKRGWSLFYPGDPTMSRLQVLILKIIPWNTSAKSLKSTALYNVYWPREKPRGQENLHSLLYGDKGRVYSKISQNSFFPFLWVLTRYSKHVL